MRRIAALFQTTPFRFGWRANTSRPDRDISPRALSSARTPPTHRRYLMSHRKRRRHGHGVNAVRTAVTPTAAAAHSPSADAAAAAPSSDAADAAAASSASND